MDRDSVKAILGEPGRVWPDGTWVYFSKYSWPRVYVHFDPEGNLARYEYDN